MNFRNIIAQIILPTIIGVIWALIGMLTEPDWEQFKIEYGNILCPYIKWLWDNRIICGIIISIIIFIIIVIMAEYRTYFGTATPPILKRVPLTNYV